MKRMFWPLQILLAGVLVVSVIMLVQDWMQPASERVELTFEPASGVQGGISHPLVCVVSNANASDIRIVGMNWC